MVLTGTDREFTAELVARDATTDLAVIKIPINESLPLIAIGTSSDLMEGEPVIALGNAFGYEHTVTRGIISALGRDVQVSDTQTYDDLIQTDASINLYDGCKCRVDFARPCSKAFSRWRGWRPPRLEPLLRHQIEETHQRTLVLIADLL